MKLLKNEVTFLNMIKYSPCKIVKKISLTFSPAPIPNAMLQWRPENVALESGLLLKIPNSRYSKSNFFAVNVNRKLS